MEALGEIEEFLLFSLLGFHSVLDSSSSIRLALSTRLCEDTMSMCGNILVSHSVNIIEDLSFLPRFAAVLFEHKAALFAEPKESNLTIAERLYCSSKQCGGMRRVMLDYNGPVPPPGLVEAFEVNGVTEEVLVRALMPALFTLICMECDADYTAVLYEQHSEPSLVIIPSEGRGISTHRTPESVSYYLDQAARAHSIGANSAAIAMFRSALEWILEDQGYLQPMLGPKLSSLQAHIMSGTAPVWMTQLHPEVLQTLKDLGNTATHTNGGNISKQQAMDVNLYRAVESSLLEVLEIIYERPAEQNERIGMMRAASSRNPHNS